MQTQVFITRRIPVAGLEALRTAGVEFVVGQDNEERGLSRSRLIEGAGSSRVLLSLLTEAVDGEVLAQPGLLGVANMAVGTNNVNIEAATDMGVPVSNTPGVLTDTTADLTWALLLAAARRIPLAHNYVTQGRFQIWGPNLMLGADVSPGGSGARKTLGVIGFGRIGRAVAKRAAGFDMRVVAFDPHNRVQVEESHLVDWMDLTELLAESDFISLHVPLTQETHHLIGEAELRRMKPTAVLVNVARGPIVNEKALVTALNEGWIGGAALDVYEREPEVEAGLLKAPNAVLVPHIGSASEDTRNKMAEMAAVNALAHLRRRPAPNVVNPEVYRTDAYRRRVEL